MFNLRKTKATALQLRVKERDNEMPITEEHTESSKSNLL